MGSVTWGADVPGGIPFSGNVTLSGCRLVGAGAADDALALDWAVHPVDANTVAVWRMNEAVWNGTAGEVIDASGNGRHGTAVGATTVEDAMDRCGNMAASENNHVLSPSISWPSTYTIEGWISHAITGTNNRLLGTSGTARTCDVRANIRANPMNWEWRAYGSYSYFSVTNDVWHHWVLQAVRGGVQRAWIDGVNVVNKTAATSALGNYTFGMGAAPYYAWGVASYFDDVRISNVERYATADNFTPRGWYPSSGSGTLTGTGLATREPVAVSWTATAGAEYGAVYRVELLDASLGWTQVGGDNPTSPIAVSGLTLAADAGVRVTLTPKADSIRSETPTLADLTLTYADPVTSSPYYYQQIIANRRGRH